MMGIEGGYERDILSLKSAIVLFCLVLILTVTGLNLIKLDTSFDPEQQIEIKEEPYNKIIGTKNHEDERD